MWAVQFKQHISIYLQQSVIFVSMWIPNLPNDFFLLQVLRKSSKHKVKRSRVFGQFCQCMYILTRLLTAGVDFSTDGFPKQVTIPAGQTSAQFEVRVINDLIVEREEQFHVSFTYSGGQPGVIVRPGFDEASIIIENDDG